MSAAAHFEWSPDPGTELRILFDNAPFGVAQCERQGYITALNPALAEILGLHTRIAEPMRFADLMASQDHAESARVLRELFDGKRDSFQIDSDLKARDGRALRWTAWRVPGKNGSPDYALALAAETAESREAELRLRRAERLEALGRVAGGVAHDFNNLLTGVLLCCDLLMAGLEPGHPSRKYAEEVRSAGTQAAGLVRQLLAMARPTDFAPRVLCINDTAEGMRDLLARLIGENIDLTLHLDPCLGLIKMDPAQVQQIVLNLVLNARDAMPGGGRISVETSNCRVEALTGSGVCTSRVAAIPCSLLVVADNGMGMDASTRAHLFEAFFTTKSAGKGTGLGLTNVHDIVTANGGLIHVESAPGQGTRVNVLLPQIPEASSASTFANGTQQEKNEGGLSQRER